MENRERKGVERVEELGKLSVRMKFDFCMDGWTGGAGLWQGRILMEIIDMCRAKLWAQRLSTACQENCEIEILRY